MSARMRQIAALAALVAVLFATGSQWVMLQSLAWASMFARYAQTDDLGTALEKTLDGQHPCPLCHRVQEGRRSERERSPLMQPDRPPDWVLVMEVVSAPGLVKVHEAIPYLNRFFLEEDWGPGEPVPRRLRPAGDLPNSLLRWLR